MVDFEIDQRNKDRWNYLVGGNYDFSKSFAVQAEVGFGGSREHVIAGAMLRF